METEEIQRLFKRGLLGLKKMTDHTGIIQHSHFSVPDPKHGYSLDDNARALIVALLAKEFDLAQIYLSFLRNAQNEEGKFSNFLNYKREWLDESSLGDSFGRAVWSLGFCVAKSPLKGLAQSAAWMFQKAYPNLGEVRDLRAVAFCILGLGYILEGKKFKEVSKSHKEIEEQIRDLAQKLLKAYEKEASSEWEWFEDTVTYENSRLPQALLVAYKYLKEVKYLKTGLKTLNFLIKIQLEEKKGYFNFVGQDGWYKRGGEKALFDQQPVEPGSTAKLLVDAFNITKKRQYLELAMLAFEWFKGKNIKNRALIDAQTGRIHDGINQQGVNQNQGAESLVSFLLACNSLISIKS